MTRGFRLVTLPFRLLGCVLREVSWSLRFLVLVVAHRPVKVAVWLIVVGVLDIAAGRRFSTAAALVPVLVVLAGGLWARLWAASFRQFVEVPRWQRLTRRGIARAWPGVMVGTGLSRPAAEGTRLVPVLSRSRWDARGQLHLVPALLVGQTVDDLDDAAERVRTAVGAHRLRVVPNSARTAAELIATFGDPLDLPFNTAAPDLAPGLAGPVVVPEHPVLGVTEDGDPWRVDLRVSTLTAGSSGSGKGSVMWSLMLTLAPAIRTGLVEVHGIDLKGGMELGLGRPLFTRYADRAETAVILLEDAVTACEERATRMAGVSRLHTASVAAPLVLVLVDELASLTAYLPDRDLLKRAEIALARLCSIGRAPGFFVWGFLQDPRKETIKARHLFTQTIGLRLKDREEVAMIHGEGAIAAGATCHKISRATPGIGYAQDETGRLVRVRAGYVSDDTLRRVAATFAAPRQSLVLLPDPTLERSSSRSRRTPRVPAEDAA